MRLRAAPIRTRHQNRHLNRNRNRHRNRTGTKPASKPAPAPECKANRNQQPITSWNPNSTPRRHNERSRAIIARLIAEGGRNVYTIEKRGVHKLIYQTAWRRKGVIGGLVEFSLELPDKMPHYVRS